MHRRSAIAIYLLIYFPILFAQAGTDFRSPLGFPLTLSGAFGEPRSNHIHSGLDFRTKETIGWPVFAAEGGRVARIKVEPGGFGKAVYISHPNGYMTVYAHLDHFSEPIQKYVEQQQYALEQFQVDLFPKDTDLPVHKGDIIAFSGNSGGSSGPHLHFEVRNDATQHILNPLLFGFPVADNEPPQIKLLVMYPMDSSSLVQGKPTSETLSTALIAGKYQLPKKQIPKAQGRIAFGIQTYDQSTDSTPYCGPYSLQLFVDGNEFYFREMNEFSFDNTRYVNSLIDYETFLRLGRRVHLLYLEPGNQSETVLRHQNRGILSFSEAGRHSVRIVAKDTQGNTSELHFEMDYSPSETPADTTLQPGWDKEQHLEKPGFKAVIPEGALYTPASLTYETAPGPAGTYSALHTLHNEYTPLHKRISLSLEAQGLPASLRQKALLVRVNEKGQQASIGGTWEKGFVTSTTYLFGSYSIAVDTIAPVITPINIADPLDFLPSNNVQIEATDELSGIKTFRGQIDGKWCLFDWDAKNNLFVHTFDTKRTSSNNIHHLEITVTDQMDNKTDFSTWFIW